MVPNMEDKKIEVLLKELSNHTKANAGHGLDDKIKRYIPNIFMYRSDGARTIKIIIDLKLNQIAAVVIILTVIVCVHIFGDKDSPISTLCEDAKIVVQFMMGDIAWNNKVTASDYKQLIPDGKDFVYYGDSVDATDSDSVVMHWQLDDGRYRVYLGNMRMKTVTADELIELQAKMIQKN